MKHRHFFLLFIVPFLPAILSSFLTYTADTTGCSSTVNKIQHTAPPDTLSDWQTLQMAIAFTESRFNPQAVGKASDYGIYQITPVYVKEINRVLGEQRFRHDEALDINKSIEMFNTMQELKNPAHDLDLAIHYHNKSAAYKKTVLQNYQLIRRYETLRKQLLQYDIQ